jgi:tetraacyldisaccharide 4'-kinase
LLKLIRILSSPFSLVFYLIIKIRNLLFDKGIFNITRCNARIISIGNITVGGSGKTPAVIYVTELLKKAGKKVGVLSRGYRRKSKGYLLVSDGKEIKCSVDECGDEMYYLTTDTNVPTAVCERRVKGVNNFLNDVKLDTVVLDDAFQHRWIHRDLDIVVIDQRFLLKTDEIEQNMMPLGMMREPFASLDRAGIVILNRKFSEKKPVPDNLKKYLENKVVFHGYYQTSGFYDVKSFQHYPVSDFVGQKSLIVCGIARPYSFFGVLEQNNIDFANKMIFADHKDYNLKEVQSIRKQFYDTNAYSVLTTQKDAVKFSKFSKELDDIDIYFLKIELKIEEEDLFIEKLNKIFK